ncbi:hypothetical protein CXB51_031748 [Gossypium anomalum]|uniref:DUF688 domain-containing protein n=1 Tax=Gossypium anomalum TaxID=47600 RepID=A0A8J5Y2J9_9ROSI|nr:hypothetical protein CXB51_031748 [Gossypium anomalum]
MGSKAEKEWSSTSKLPLFSSPHAHMQSPEKQWVLTPPHHALASVPFRWEEEPGKPKPCCTTTITTTYDLGRKCLELPPRLLILDAAKNTAGGKLYSPTTVLDGPYMGKARFQSSSFRIGSECYGSFRSGSFSPENMVVHGGGGGGGAMVVSSKRVKRDKGFLGSRRRDVFPSFGDEYGSSFNTLSRSKSHFWGSIYQGLKQVVPWSKRGKKDRFMA